MDRLRAHTTILGDADFGSRGSSGESTDTEFQMPAIYYYALDKDQQQLVVGWGQLIDEQHATAAMTSTDTIESIISDLNKQRDSRGVVDTNSVLTTLARINVLFWREYGDEPLSANNLSPAGPLRMTTENIGAGSFPFGPCRSVPPRPTPHADAGATQYRLTPALGHAID